jgi:predicted Zn-dependent protease
MAKGETKQAIESVGNGERFVSGQVPVLKYRLAEAYARATTTAIRPFRSSPRSSRRDPSYIDPVLALADLNLRARNAAPVVTSMAELVQKRPDLPQARLLLAGAYQQLGQFDEAVVLLQEQIKRFPMTLSLISCWALSGGSRTKSPKRARRCNVRWDFRRAT